MDHGPRKHCALAAALLPGEVRRSAARAHVARQMPPRTTALALLEMEVPILTAVPELLFDRVLRSRQRLGRGCDCSAGLGGEIFVHQSNLRRMAMLPSPRAEEHQSEHQSLMSTSYAVFTLKK